MARGRKAALTIHFTAEERLALIIWQRLPTLPAGHARRGQMILLLADGMPITQIATTVGMSRRVVYKWVKRFLEHGVAGLADKSGRGRSRRPRQHNLT